MPSLSESYNHLDNMVLTLEQGRPLAEEKRDAYAKQIIEESLVNYARDLLEIKSFQPIFKADKILAMQRLVWKSESVDRERQGFKDIDGRDQLFEHAKKTSSVATQAIATDTQDRRITNSQTAEEMSPEVRQVIVADIENGRYVLPQVMALFVQTIIDKKLVDVANKVLEAKYLYPIFEHEQRQKMQGLVWESESADWAKQGIHDIDGRRNLF